MSGIAHKTSAILEVQRIAAELPKGGETRTVCPHCGGGSSKERSMSIKRFSEVRASYTCWRATCDLGYGSVSIFGNGKTLLNSKMAPQDIKKKGGA